MWVIMETIHWIAAAMAALIVGVASAGACVFFFKRRIDELTRRMNKIDKARQTALQHGLQARTQIDMLQKELAEQQRQRSQQTRTTQQQVRREELDLVLEAADRSAALAAATSFTTRGPLPKSGFADTMPV